MFDDTPMSSPSVNPVSQPHQSAPSVSPISQPLQSAPSVNPFSQPHQSSPSVIPSSQPLQSAPSVIPISHPQQSAPSVSPISHPHQSSPSVIPISHPHQSSPSVSPVSHPRQSSPSVIPSVIPVSQPRQSSPSVSPVSQPRQSTPLVNPIGHPRQSTPSVNSISQRRQSTPSVIPSSHPRQSSPSVIPVSHPHQSSPSVIPNSHHRQSSPSVSPSSQPRQSSPAVIPVSHPRQSSPSVIPISHPHQSTPSVNPISQPHQSSPSVIPISHPHQSSPSVIPISHPHQSTPSVNPISQPHQSSPSVIPISHPHQSSPSVIPISHPHQSSPSVIHVSHPRQSSPSVIPIGQPHRSSPSVIPIGHPRQSTPSVNPVSQRRQSTPSVNSINQLHQSTPSVIPVSQPCQSAPSVSPVSQPRQSAPSVNPISQPHLRKNHTSRLVLHKPASVTSNETDVLPCSDTSRTSSDIWSLGVILYMLVCGHPPFQEANDSETLIMIMDCRYTVPDHVSAECKDLISRMLQRDPSQRAGLVDIEAHPWLQGVDPSPSGHSAAPLTSHRSLSPHEHELILQAMTSGNIADRDTIQEALEADRYNHITATYYLLGERILRDKQEQTGLALEQRHAQRPLSEPLDLVEGRIPQVEPLKGATLAPVTALGSLSPGFPRRGVCESGDLLAPKPSRQDGSFADFASPSPSLGLCLRSVAPEPAPAMKSLGALQQICEEEEEEEEEEGEGEAPLEPQPPQPSLVVSTEPSPQSSIHCLEVKAQGGLRQVEGKGRHGILVQEEEHQDEGVESVKENMDQDLAASIGRVPEEHRVENTSTPPREDKEGSQTGDTNHNQQTWKEGWVKTYDQLSNVSDRAEDDQNLQKLGLPEPRLSAVQCCLGQREPFKDTLEDNNNTPSKPKLLDKGVISAPCSSPRSLPKNHCVDLGPDGVEMRRTGGEGEKTEETQTKPQPGQRISRDAGMDIKNKNVNLRDRLLQFPLCEKALSFNIQPTSKEKLLPFAQYNCCHVL
ncbi:hypothetical protein NFI96_004754 [Prochilodus magdalenae]|nr:hypothetical protein NFI96_004754 [Prochilodus magdalenae]